MAAKKKSDDVLGELFSTGALMKASDSALDIRRVSSGLAPLDAVLGGGYAYGRNVMILGPESTGKTILAQYAAAAIQKDDPAANVLLVDTEMSFDRTWWEASGVDLSRLYVSRPATGEDAVNLIISTLQNDPTLRGIILDSVATLSPAVVQEKQSGERSIASIAVIVANLFQKLLPINHNAVFIALNQLRANLTGYEDNFPGGWVLRHNSHVILRTRREGWIKDGDGKQRLGYVMEIHVKKNKLGQPEETIQVPFMFESQIDLIGSYIDEAINKGLIEQRGPYYRWGELQLLGKGAVRAHFGSNETDFAALKAAVEGKVA